jgi:hypothetical protein
MTPNQVKALMDRMEELAVENRGKKVDRAVLDNTLGSVEVSARANRIGFVYWYYDRKPLPRKRVQGLLERPEIKEVL